jgi:tRNA pseudouridine13 synthase
VPSLPPLDLSLPYVTEGLEGIGGRIRARPEDFVVDEVALYEPSGTGSHLYVNLTKVNVTTRDVQLQLAQLFRLRPENIGTAGLKDKHAVATQTFSILFERGDARPGDVAELIEGSVGVKVNWARWHANKFRAGHLVGNRFQVTVTDVHMPQARALELSRGIAERIHERGLPNYYGEQRTGRHGKNVEEGWEILRGRKTFADRWLRKLLVAGYQSYLCNRYLAERLRRGLFDGLLLGDIAKRHETGGIFWVNDLEAEQPRYLAKEISFTAPMYGYRMSQPAGDSARLEAEILEESDITFEDLRSHGVTGTRRLGRLVPRVEVAAVPRGIRLGFMLHKGGFATTLLREFMKNSPE